MQGGHSGDHLPAEVQQEVLFHLAQLALPTHVHQVLQGGRGGGGEEGRRLRRDVCGVCVGGVYQ